MKLFYSDVFELPLPPKHRFPMAKYRLLRERVEASGKFPAADIQPAPEATDLELETVHDSDYVRRVATGELTDLEIRRIGFPWSEKMVIRSRRSTGASIAAANAAMDSGVAVNLAGGTHHAFPESGQGYCVFNDVAVAAKVCQQQNLVQNVLFIDCDVHQGNGTAAVAKNDATLFAFSMHCNKNFPFRKTAGDLDIGVDEGTEDEEYLDLLNKGLDQVFNHFQPDLVFYVSGADPYEGDRLGHLRLTKAGLRKRDELVLNRCLQDDLPVAISMAGGYAPKIDDIVDIHFQTIATAQDIFRSTRAVNPYHGTSR